MPQQPERPQLETTCTLSAIPDTEPFTLPCPGNTDVHDPDPYVGNPVTPDAKAQPLTVPACQPQEVVPEAS